MKRTPFNAIHRELGGKMVEFGGWEMPIQYSGIVDEHNTVRTSVGVFDVSHMGDFRVSGPGATQFLNRVQTNEASTTRPMQAKYTHILNEKGQIMDDMIFTRLGDNDYWVVVNAATTRMDWEHFASNATKDVKLENLSDDYACIAVQGPKAMRTVQKLTAAEVMHMPPFTMKIETVGGFRTMVSKTGYTGEDGCELILSDEDGVRLWPKVFEAGKEFGIKPIGLGARDTLRLEMGMLLSGQDFHFDRTSLETHCGFVVKFTHDFIGRKVLEEQKAKGGLDAFVGLVMRDRAIPRHGYDVRKDGAKVSVCTSGTMSPTLKKGIALCYLPPALASPGTEVEVVVRGEPHPAVVTRLPFLEGKRQSLTAP